MNQPITEERISSFVESKTYLDASRLRENITLQLFLKTDTQSHERIKRARNLDRYDLSRTTSSSGTVCVVAPELAQCVEDALGLARSLASRGWSVRLVTRLLPESLDEADRAALTVHFVRPLNSYASAISGRGPVLCFGPEVAAGLVLGGHKCICCVAEKDEEQLRDGALYIPDFLIGDAGVSGRNIFPLDLDVVEKLLCAKTRALPRPPRVPTVSACLIVRDEEGVVEECLESLVPFADETIVNDTGSLDRTPEIAMAYGARVIRTKWPDDFSKARNDALSQARCSYVLTIDADERLVSETVSEAKTRLTDGSEAWHVSIRNETRGNETSITIVRLFRNRLHHRYSGRIHEQIVHTIKGTVASSPLVARHVGYDPSHSAAKGKRQRNIDLLTKAISSDSVFAKGYLEYQAAVELLHLGNFYEGLEAMLKVVENTEKHAPFRPIAALHACNVLINQDRMDELLPLVMGLLEDYPGFAQVAVTAAGALLDSDRTDDAEAVLRSVDLEKEQVGLPKSDGADTYRLSLVWARIALNRGEKDLAYRHILKALEHKPDFAPAQSLLVDGWSERATEILSQVSPGTVRPAVLRCLLSGQEELALEIAHAAKDPGAEGEIHLAEKDYAQAAACFKRSSDEWDLIRAEILVESGLAGGEQVNTTTPSGPTGLVTRLLSGEPCGISELSMAGKVLGFLLDLGRDREVEKVLESLRPFGERAESMVAQVFQQRGKLDLAFERLQRVSDTPDYLPLKARLAYRLEKHAEAAAYYAALEALMPLGPEDSIYYVNSLVKCKLLDMAREAASQTFARYPWNSSAKRLAEILGVAHLAQ
ncbi:MAG: glycosyltransferase [Bacillota bacterium]|jgi:tetratricopeptide (TPR) repeat protein|nr:glycosyltransferase [Candidatus Fermentithermobacillaceae bacterium]